MIRAPLRILYFTSAVFYLPEMMPAALRDLLAWNPIMHGISMLREGYYKGYQCIVLDMQYFYGWAVACLLLGLVAEKAARKALRSLA
jgi:capsular polysaccharide transport system permease protein